MLPLLFLLACTDDETPLDSAVDSEPAVVTAEDADLDGYPADEDCDDANAAVHPGAAEICDGLDNDCDEAIDEDVLEVFYLDADGDGFGDPQQPIEACDRPDDAVPTGTDCDDTDAGSHPGALEACDGVDNDCDGEADEDGGVLWFRDVDGDGYGDSEVELDACEQPDGYVLDAQDCDDADAARSPESEWHPDVDGDGYGDAEAWVVQCEQPSGYLADGQDCDDLDASLSPDTLWYADVDEDGYGDADVWTQQCEAPDGAVLDDTDCDDADDELNPTTVWYADADSDGYGDPDSALVQCEEPAGHLRDDASDCDDTDPDRNPTTVWYVDADADGYGDAASTLTQCEEPSGYAATGDDCEDSDPDLNPATVWYADDDGDGYGDPGETRTQCAEPSGFTLDNGDDCDDTDADIHPDTVWYADADSDGYGDPSTSVTQCAQPSAYGLDSSDCDDTDAEVNPDAAEVCDDVDNDCDGSNDPDIVVPYDEATVADALDAAWAGDWICVLAGTYLEGELTLSTQVILEGEDRDTTLLDAAGSSTLLKVDVDDAEVLGFQLSGATSSLVAVQSGHTGIVIEDVLVEGESLDGRVAIQYANSEVTWRRVDAVENTVTVAGSLYGAFLYQVAGSTAVLENVRVLDSVHECGNQCLAQLYVTGATAEVYNSVFSGNEVLETDGAAWVSGGVWTSTGGDLYLENVSLVGNYSSSGTGWVSTNGVYAHSASDVIELVNVDVSHNALGSYGGLTAGGVGGNSSASITASYSNVYGNDGGDWDSDHDPGSADGNVSADPVYTDVSAADAADWDLTPGTGSSLLDAGDPSMTDVDGSTCDIGALGGLLGDAFYD